MEQIFKDLLIAHKAEEVRRIIIKIGKSKMRWDAVGNRKNNLATINIGTDPASGVTERITNAIDAVLEKEWKIKEEPTDIKSPRKASEIWYGIPDGRISKIEDALDNRIQDLSDKIQVTLFDSGKDTKPTVEIRDKGIGLEPEQFSETILDLNGNNKIGKLHLMGAYGQGGSTALSYNNLTIIISKPFFGDQRKKKKVAFTIVRINEGDINKDKHEWYEYMVDKSTGQPFTLEIDDDVFEPGTLVRHIMMDIGKYKGVITTQTNSLWYLAHNYLFDPIIPFTISDRRNDRNVNRTVTGNNRLLTNNPNLDYFNEISLTFKDGSLKIYYWILNTTGENPKNRISGYASVSNPIIICFNGQKQGTLGNGIIKNDLKLPFLDRYIIVQIEADNMDNDSKRQIFSSTRESLRDTSILADLKKLTIDTLKEDDNLVRLDSERRQRYFTKDDTQVLDSLKKRLARRINSFLSSSGQGTSVTTSTLGETAKSEKLPEITIEDPPSFFEIVTKSPKEVYPNKTFSIKFKTDAHPNYFAQAETFAAFIDPQSFGSFTGTARVNNGYGIAYFKVNEETDIGETGEISLELRPPRLKTISASVDLIAVESPENSDTDDNGKNKSPNIEVSFVDKNSAIYQDNDWDNTNVGEVANSQDGVFISISEENKNLTKLVAKAQRQNDQAVQNIKNKYLEHISFYAFMLDQNKPEKFLSEEDNELSDGVYQKIKESELRNASETVCGMINDFFELIITESIESETE
ncbi:hypothetical protein ES692_17050 [Psychroserpens burtonensis]|uniref:Uncharacterized protein n=1 Tax=Psychroserpens burtonensis TaxID=49278 RepID=A0A5C7B337_9FLAO|nr:hypothetical protein [Psychroserpens burtonensis]TXE15364.1 hypothetical protein ES692_17050 [Psychroserpens burtonensis]